MAKFLFATFLIAISFKLLADVSLPGQTECFAQPEQETDSSTPEENLETGEKQIAFNFTFRFVRLSHRHALQATLTSGFWHGDPLRGFTNSSFTPPESSI